VIAGPESGVGKLKPYTVGVMGRSVVDLGGKSPADATLLKVIGNTFVFNLVEAVAQGHALAERTGLGVDALHKFVEQMFPGPHTAYSKRMREGDYFKREEVSRHFGKG
jgi:3-hydroxyisobutyrate dehydrogenase-like beta-hydroxyacid dehydrogenase